MTTEMLSLRVLPRSLMGKGVGRLRRSGVTPLHMYGPGIASLALQAEAAPLRRTLARAGKSRPLSVQVEGEAQPHIAFVREVQFNPLTEEVLHVDLYRVDITHRLEVEVPIELRGEAPAIGKGGTLFQGLHSLRVECLPLETPEVILVDVSGLDDFEKAVRAKDIQVPANVKIITDPEQVVAYVAPPVAVEEEKPAEVVVEEGAEPSAEAPAEEGETKEEKEG